MLLEEPARCPEADDRQGMTDLTAVAPSLEGKSSPVPYRPQAAAGNFTHRSSLSPLSPLSPELSRVAGVSTSLRVGTEEDWATYTEVSDFPPQVELPSGA